MKKSSAIDRMYKRHKTISNIKQNMKTPKLGGGLGVPAPQNIAKALGVSVGFPIHIQMAAKLLNHPDSNVAAAAKRLMAKY